MGVSNTEFLGSMKKTMTKHGVVALVQGVVLHCCNYQCLCTDLELTQGSSLDPYNISERKLLL